MSSWEPTKIPRNSHKFPFYHLHLLLHHAPHPNSKIESPAFPLLHLLLLLLVILLQSSIFNLNHAPPPKFQSFKMSTLSLLQLHLFILLSQCLWNNPERSLAKRHTHISKSFLHLLGFYNFIIHPTKIPRTKKKKERRKVRPRKERKYGAVSSRATRRSP